MERMSEVTMSIALAFGACGYFVALRALNPAPFFWTAFLLAVFAFRLRIDGD